MLKALLLLAAVSPQQFDLACSGERNGFRDGGQTYVSRIRVDLTSRRWCDGSCDDINRIYEVSRTRLTLSHSFFEAGGDLVEEHHFVDRLTGQHFMGFKARDSNHWLSGTCEKRPFSGFPRLKTKF